MSIQIMAMQPLMANPAYEDEKVEKNDRPHQKTQASESMSPLRWAQASTGMSSPRRHVGKGLGSIPVEAFNKDLLL